MGRIPIPKIKQFLLFGVNRIPFILLSGTFRKQNRSQKNMNTVHSAFSYCVIVTIECAQSRLSCCYRVCSRCPCWRSETMKYSCLKITFISKRKIISIVLLPQHGRRKHTTSTSTFTHGKGWLSCHGVLVLVYTLFTEIYCK